MTCRRIGNAIVCGGFPSMCRVAGCKRQRPKWALMCKKCWEKVPADMRHEMMDTRAHTAERLQKAREVLDWFKQGQQELQL